MFPFIRDYPRLIRRREPHMIRNVEGSNEGVYRLKYGNHNEQKTLEIVEIPRVSVW